MSTTVSWQEIAIRLSLTIIAATLIGINRSEHGRPAGLRHELARMPGRIAIDDSDELAAGHSG